MFTPGQFRADVEQRLEHPAIWSPSTATLPPQKKPKPPTVEERLTSLEKRVTALEKTEF